MSNETSENTIYVGNIQSISDDQIREYFDNFAPVESISRPTTSSQDDWLIDYRFVRFARGTDLSRFLSNRIDHSICRIRLDIQSYDAACRDDTRLISDRKICIAHTDPKLNRNVVKKAFSRYGRILNCQCVSSGHGIEYVYIEFESINSVVAICQSNKTHYAGKTRLAVRRTLRPSKIVVKSEPTTTFETVQYSSVETKESIEKQNENDDQEDLKEFENEYDLVICQRFDEINAKLSEFIENQRTTFKKVFEEIRRF